MLKEYGNNFWEKGKILEDYYSLASDDRVSTKVFGQCKNEREFKELVDELSFEEDTKIEDLLKDAAFHRAYNPYIVFCLFCMKFKLDVVVYKRLSKKY